MMTGYLGSGKTYRHTRGTSTQSFYIFSLSPTMSSESLLQMKLEQVAPVFRRSVSSPLVHVGVMLIRYLIKTNQDSKLTQAFCNCD